ncbi:MAG: gamma-glutamyl-gamma-aminobutyrate hydrolase family protein [archaeon GB-1867-005]|nr:gamma-glutamyl-gamma-aminobutyrate hydrolase family protein [Candidatus Culexmicrobium cathedralense]
MKPIIGITCSYDWNKGYFRLNRAYVTAIERAGGVPIILPSISPDNIREIVGIVDGVLLSGGVDIDPHLYGEKPIHKMGKIDPDRDLFEIELTKEVLRRELPLLAICRGIQVLNVAAGGTLYQDIESQVKGSIKHKWHTPSGLDAPPSYPTHIVKIKAGSMLHKIFGKQELRVNSFHHQAVKDVGKKFIATAWAEDEVIEAIEYTGSSFILGVQWHPEWMMNSEMMKIFEEFVKRAAELARS